MIREIVTPLFATGLPVLLAQLPPPKSEELFGWLSCAVAVLGIYYLVLRVVKEHKAPARNPTIESEMQAMEARIDQRRSTGIGNLHGRQNAFEKEINSELMRITATLAATVEVQKNNSADIAEQNRQISTILTKLPRARS